MKAKSTSKNKKLINILNFIQLKKSNPNNTLNYYLTKLELSLIPTSSMF